MRKHDVRKWLHAILDLLPVIIIPVFMIYSHRHQIDSYTIDVPQKEVVDFNQYSNVRQLTFDSTGGRAPICSYIDFKKDDIYVLKVTQANNVTTIVRNVPVFDSASQGLQQFASIVTDITGDLNVTPTNNTNLNSGTHYSRFKFISDYTAYISYWYADANVGNNLFDFQLFNLTQMFGSGNEPSYTQFVTYYDDDYYDYVVSRKELLNVGTLTYDDTDIGSQMMYCLYNSVDKYFNLNNVFGFNNVYDWLSLNIFNGNPPIAIFIVWNIALYEFLMDLIMLLYALFMWFIDMCENLIDRSFHVASGRKK